MWAAPSDTVACSTANVEDAAWWRLEVFPKMAIDENMSNRASNGHVVTDESFR